jgi:cell division protein FtsZ
MKGVVAAGHHLTAEAGAQVLRDGGKCGADLSLWEVNEAARAVAEAAHPSANIIFGAMVDEKIAEECWVTVVATGYGDRPTRRGSTATFREPSGEPRVRRRDGTADLAGDFEIPEFVPQG